MAAGEYVSVRSPTPKAPTRSREAAELQTSPDAELRELAAIYVRRGLPPELARTVAERLTAHDARSPHARRARHHRDPARATARGCGHVGRGVRRRGRSCRWPRLGRRRALVEPAVGASTRGAGALRRRGRVVGRCVVSAQRSWSSLGAAAMASTAALGRSSGTRLTPRRRAAPGRLVPRSTAAPDSVTRRRHAPPRPRCRPRRRRPRHPGLWRADHPSGAAPSSATGFKRAQASYAQGDLDDARAAADSALAATPKDRTRACSARRSRSRARVRQAARHASCLPTRPTRSAAAPSGTPATSSRPPTARAAQRDPTFKDSWVREVAKLARRGHGRHPYTVEGGMLAAVEMPRRPRWSPCELEGERIRAVATGMWRGHDRRVVPQGPPG